MSNPAASASDATRPVALVIGGGSGLGSAVVRGLAARGWAVAIHAHASFSAARAAAEALAAAGVPALAVTADLRDEGPLRVLVRRVVDRFGRLDALVDCAALGRDVPFADMTADDLRAHLDVGLVGMVVLAQEAGAVMAGQDSGGMIVLAFDAAADPPPPGRLAAAIVAGAIPAAARALAAELPRVPVHAVAVAGTEAERAAAMLALFGPPGVG